MKIKLNDKITLRPVTVADLHEVARMWDFEKGKISIEEAAKAIQWMTENHQKNQLHKLHHLC